MKGSLCICVAILAPLTAFAVDESDDAEALQGIWMPVKAELGGQPMPDAVLTITLKLKNSEKEAA